MLELSPKQDNAPEEDENEKREAQQREHVEGDSRHAGTPVVKK
jgi:hypothetical protein